MHIDLTTILGEVTRVVSRREHDGRPARVVQISRRYATDPADLWDALTNETRLPRWFAPVTGELRLGGRYQVKGNAGGTITRCDPPQTFALTWEFGGEVSWVTVTLTAHGAQTELVLEHLAYVDDARWGQFGPGAVGVGWELSVLGMLLHLQSGASVDHAEVERWSTSENGVGFLKGSAQAWGEAAILDGDPPEAARAAAARTAAFYTGT